MGLKAPRAPEAGMDPVLRLLKEAFLILLFEKLGGGHLIAEAVLCGSLRASLCYQYRSPGRCGTCSPLQRPLTVPPPSQERGQIVDRLQVNEAELAPHSPWSPPSFQSQRGG